MPEVEVVTVNWNDERIVSECNRSKTAMTCWAGSRHPRRRSYFGKQCRLNMRYKSYRNRKIIRLITSAEREIEIWPALKTATSSSGKDGYLRDHLWIGVGKTRQSILLNGWWLLANGRAAQKNLQAFAWRFRKFWLGEWWDSNPRPSESQSDVLTGWTTSTVLRTANLATWPNFAKFNCA